MSTGEISHRTMHATIYEPERSSEHTTKESKNKACNY